MQGGSKLSDEGAQMQQKQRKDACRLGVRVSGPMVEVDHGCKAV